VALPDSDEEVAVDRTAAQSVHVTLSHQAEHDPEREDGEIGSLDPPGGTPRFAPGRTKRDLPDGVKGDPTADPARDAVVGDTVLSLDQEGKRLAEVGGQRLECGRRGGLPVDQARNCQAGRGRRETGLGPVVRRSPQRPAEAP
jgi:hypothetical protein